MGEQPDGLEEGEVVDGDDPEHWISVYSDLLTVNYRLLDEIATFSKDEVDAEILSRHIRRLEERLAIWKERLPS